MPMEPCNLSTPLAPSSWSRVVSLAVGYIVTLVGVLSVFSIPFYASLLLFAVGAVIALLSDRTKIPMTPSSWIVLLAGGGLIFGVLAWFGDDRIHHWRPFPAGYIPAWIFSFGAFRHVRYLISHNRRVHHVVA
jgi:hypothetical protein